MAYALDFRGYGQSTRPDFMRDDPKNQPPYCRTADAVRDLEAAVNWILKKHGVKKINLIGWSWGTVVAAQFTSLNNDKVARLALYAPVYLQLDKPFADIQGSYRVTTTENAKQGRLNGIPAGREEEISPIAWFDIMWAKNLASDAEGAKMDPPVMRSPNGGLKDLSETFSRGVSTYDPAKVTVPTLLAVGEWDMVTPVATSLRLLNDLKNAPNRMLLVVPEGTHSLIHERNRMTLLTQIQKFLEEK
jgi:pimeloyl-ACP methyl ester carboxylesterase